MHAILLIVLEIFVVSCNSHQSIDEVWNILYQADEISYWHEEIKNKKFNFQPPLSRHLLLEAKFSGFKYCIFLESQKKSENKKMAWKTFDKEDNCEKEFFNKNLNWVSYENLKIIYDEEPIILINEKRLIVPRKLNNPLRKEGWSFKDKLYLKNKYKVWKNLKNKNESISPGSFCIEYDKNCEKVINDDCRKCLGGWYPTPVANCYKKNHKICGHEKCGGRGEYACFRGSQHQKKITHADPCSVNILRSFCEEGLIPTCEQNRYLICY